MNSTPVHALVQQYLRRRPVLDVKSTIVALIMTAGLPALIYFHAAGVIQTLVAIPLAVLLMNLSFTAWHEPAHGTLSKSATINTLVGILTSFASVYPGYFARRREHLIHHRWEGVDGKDPVYPRIQTTFWGFPLQLIRLSIHPPRLSVPATFLPRTPLQRMSDTLSNLGALAIVALSFAYGFWESVLLLWIVPRGVVFWLHAYYICFFPHAIQGGGYQVHRIQAGKPWLRFLTVCQSLHGIHHKWPTLPWHAYPKIARSHHRELASLGFEIKRHL